MVYATHHTLGDKDVTDETFRVAWLAKQAFANGQIELVQNRTEKHGPFDYVAIKRKQVKPPTVLGEPWRVKLLGKHGDYI